MITETKQAMTEDTDIHNDHEQTTGNDGDRSSYAKASAARLMAVQAVYQLIYSRVSAQSVIEDFLYHRTGNNLGEDVEAMPPDGRLFSGIVHGAQKDHDNLDAIVAHYSGKHWREMDALLLAVLRCFAYEIVNHSEIDAPILITDYIEVTKAFYDRDETRLVNGITDAMARDIRQ